ncbi:NUDIX domain-containing protein [bacterium]|nr:MAG: NUDIX domain-containing protein [bacterium]
MKDEYLDIVDENDNVKSKDTRENIWKRGLEHNVRVVNIFIFNSKKELLLPKRSMDRRIFPGCYDFSCGEHVQAGEDYYDAAVRGLKEELGIVDQRLVELGKITPKEGVNCFMKVYKLTYDREINNYDKKGIDNLFWYDLAIIKKMVKEDKSKFKEDFPIVLELLQQLI